VRYPKYAHELLQLVDELDSQYQTGPYAPESLPVISGPVIFHSVDCEPGACPATRPAPGVMTPETVRDMCD